MGVLINPVHFRRYWGVRYNIWSIGDHSAQLLNTYAACRCAESVLWINGGIIWLWIWWCSRCDWYWWHWLWFVSEDARTRTQGSSAPTVRMQCVHCMLLIPNVTVALSTGYCRFISPSGYISLRVSRAWKTMYISMHTHYSLWHLHRQTVASRALPLPPCFCCWVFQRELEPIWDLSA